MTLLLVHNVVLCSVCVYAVQMSSVCCRDSFHLMKFKFLGQCLRCTQLRKSWSSAEAFAGAAGIGNRYILVGEIFVIDT